MTASNPALPQGLCREGEKRSPVSPRMIHRCSQDRTFSPARPSVARRFLGEARCSAQPITERSGRGPAASTGPRIARRRRARPEPGRSAAVACRARSSRPLRPGFGTAADQREIAARSQEPPRRIGSTPGLGDRRHLEVVAQNEAVEAEASPQHARDDCGRQRAGQVRVERADRTCATRTAGAAGREKRRGTGRARRAPDPRGFAGVSGKA